MQKIEACPICQGKEFTLFLNCQDHSVSKEVFSIVQCENCSFKFTNPIPSENSIGKYYKSENYISHSDTKKGLVNRVYHIVRNITLKKKLNLVNSLSPKGNLLDVGCGTGYFLKTCKDDGWKIDGTEPDDHARKLAEQNTQQTLYSSVLQLEKIKQYNVVSMWHVLEHVHKLNETIIKLSMLLKDNGKLIIAVPNSDSKDAATYKENWAAYDVPRHLYHFNQKSMADLLSKHGFEIERTAPMKFDSFYVSMISEGYISGNQNVNYISSILNGWKSNIYGMFNKNNYSSIIYIARKKDK